jgi:class 3 adenylate cyclase
MERRLAAILAADVVGYSRLMGDDEEATLATLNAYREIIDGLVADHRLTIPRFCTRFLDSFMKYFLVLNN